MRGVAAGPSSPATTRVRGNTWSFSKVRTISRCQYKKFSDVSLASRFTQAGEVGYCPWIHPPLSPPKWLSGAARRCADVGNERTWAARTHVPGAGWAKLPLAGSVTDTRFDREGNPGRESTSNMIARE